MQGLETVWVTPPQPFKHLDTSSLTCLSHAQVAEALKILLAIMFLLPSSLYAFCTHLISVVGFDYLHS